MPYKINPFTGEFDLVAHAGEGEAVNFDADSGTAVPVGGILNVLGSSLQGTQTSASGDTLVVSVLSASETQKGTLELASNSESIAGADTTRAIVSTGLKAKLGTQTAKSMPFGAGDNAALSWTSALSDGKIVIGSTSGTPQAASLTSTDGSIVITNGSNSIDLSTSSTPHNQVQTIDTDSGTVTPDVAGLVNLFGTSAQGLTTSGTGNTATLTISDASTTQKGVSELATSAEVLTGTDTVRPIVPSALTAKLGTQTSKGIAFGSGTTSAIGWTSGLTDGRLVIGSTAGNPQAGTITSLDGSVTVTLGSNTIDLSTGGGPEDVESIITDSGTVLPNASGEVSLVGTPSQGVSTTGSGSVATITVADSTTSQRGVVELATNAETITGTDTTRPVVPSALNAKLGTQTANGVCLGGGAGASLLYTGVLGDGQLLIGRAGLFPQLGNITSSDGSITVTNTPGAISLSAAGGIDYTTYTNTFTGTINIASWTLAQGEYLYVKVIYFMEDLPNPQRGAGSFEAIVTYNQGASALQLVYINAYGSQGPAGFYTNLDIGSGIFPNVRVTARDLGISTTARHLIWSYRYL